MFNWFRNWFTPRENLASDMEKIGNDMNKVMPDIKPIPPIPNIPTNKVNDHYRIGYDSTNGATTLTLIADYTSMTLSLGPEEVMRLIRMLGATLDDEDIIGNMHDGDLDEDDE
jgi:hypothetical protein